MRNCGNWVVLGLDDVGNTNDAGLVELDALCTGFDELCGERR
jgi:hypothetical protein